MALDATAVRDQAIEAWEGDALGVLCDYLLIPAKSPAYEPDWATAGHLDRAAELLADWCRSRLAPIAGSQVEIVRLAGLTPVLVLEIPGFGDGPGGTYAGIGGGRSSVGADGPAEPTVLVYGHLDKQPKMAGWSDGLSPWNPVRRGMRLYGRGGADDGYSVLAAVTAIEAIHAHGGSHARCIVVVEASEESGSPHLPAYVDALRPRLGRVDLVIALDSGGPTFDRLWTTKSLRGLVNGRLDVSTHTVGIHSGGFGGIGPSTFRILRRLLERIEDAETGRILLDEAHVTIPASHVAAASALASLLGYDAIAARVPFLPGVTPVDADPTELVLNTTWRPVLEVTGIEGAPAIASAGNVLRPSTSVKLSLRIPPTADATTVATALAQALEADPPYGAHVDYEVLERASGWSAPETAPWLSEALEQASQAFWGAPAGSTGEGGSIPFMGMLGAMFPEAQFVIMGVIGPGTNEHGPDEFLHLPSAVNITAAVASVLDAHHRQG